MIMRPDDWDKNEPFLWTDPEELISNFEISANACFANLNYWQSVDEREPSWEAKQQIVRWGQYALWAYCEMVTAVYTANVYIDDNYLEGEDINPDSW